VNAARRTALAKKTERQGDEPPPKQVRNREAAHTKVKPPYNSALTEWTSA
jgi:hypothetical protein